MRIFSKHRKKIEPSRRFGSPEFRNKIKQAQNYRRTIEYKFHRGLLSRFLAIVGLRTFWSKFLTSAVIIVAAYFLFVSDYFLITEVAAAGNQQISASELSSAINRASQTRWFLIPRNHYILMSKGRIGKMLGSEFALLKEIEKSDRHWPDRIDIKIKERYPGFVLESKNKRYLVDEEGFVVKEISEPSDLLVLSNQAGEDFEVGETLSPKLTAFVISMQKAWPSKFTSKLDSIKIPAKASTEVVFASSEGWSVFFDINRSVQIQLNSLALILNKQVSSRSRLAYIDLRLAKWAYICYKNTPCFTQAQPEAEGAVNGVEKK